MDTRDFSLGWDGFSNVYKPAPLFGANNYNNINNIQ
jgi:hypothetical protein